MPKRDTPSIGAYAHREILELFGKIRTHRRGDQRAPHKPLLVLLALQRILRGENGPIAYSDVAKQLPELLKIFGGPHKSVRPHYPFWRLQADGIWEVLNRERIRETSKGDPLVNDLNEANAQGQFTPELREAFAKNKELSLQVAYRILDDHFPPSLHNQILASFEIDESVFDDQLDLVRDQQNELDYEIYRRLTRNPAFSKKVREAYGNKCSVCKFAIAIRSKPIALEAAHIKWHSHNGPDLICNGIALCSLHHLLFDRGAFTLSDALKVEVSEHANGEGRQEWLEKFDRKEICLPARSANRPADRFIEWHREQVYDK